MGIPYFIPFVGFVDLPVAASDESTAVTSTAPSTLQQTNPACSGLQPDRIDVTNEPIQTLTRTCTPLTGEFDSEVHEKVQHVEDQLVTILKVIDSLTGEVQGIRSSLGQVESRVNTYSDNGQSIRSALSKVEEGVESFKMDMQSSLSEVRSHLSVIANEITTLGRAQSEQISSQGVQLGNIAAKIEEMESLVGDLESDTEETEKRADEAIAILEKKEEALIRAAEERLDQLERQIKDSFVPRSSVENLNILFTDNQDRIQNELSSLFARLNQNDEAISLIKTEQEREKAQLEEVIRYQPQHTVPGVEDELTARLDSIIQNVSRKENELESRLNTVEETSYETIKKQSDTVSELGHNLSDLMAKLKEIEEKFESNIHQIKEATQYINSPDMRDAPAEMSNTALAELGSMQYQITCEVEEALAALLRRSLLRMGDFSQPVQERLKSRLTNQLMPSQVFND